MNMIFCSGSLLALILGLYAAGANADAAPGTSALWGQAGERWTDQSRLPDFSFAGYRCGETPIPQIAVTTSVMDFGAKGDGVADDTQAFIKAVNETPKGAIFIPQGRYVLTQVVKITKSNLVLRGAGPDKTILVIPKSLSDIAGPQFNDGKSRYSFTGGFITVAGSMKGEKLADVAEPAKRGDRQLVLSAPLDIAPGTFIRLTMTDADHTLGRYLHADQEDAGVDTYKGLAGKNWIDWAARVAAVTGNRVTLDRPLRLDVRPEWKPEIRAYDPAVAEVGIEDLAFEFPGVAKQPHLKEEGFNSIHITNAANCWVRNVVFTDADNGVIVGGSRFCTVANTRFRAAKRKGMTGHHALWATGGSQDCLFTGFAFDTTYVHDLTVEGRANGNVFRDGSGVSLNFDHHRNVPYENLFTNLDVGNPRRVWQSSGRGDRGPHTGARATFWNLRGKGTFPKPPNWPQINVIGVGGYARATTDDKSWIEPASDGIQPPDLYEAQLKRRLEKAAPLK